MYIPAELTMVSHKPLYLDEGMLFFKIRYPGSDREYAELWALDKPPQDEEVFLLVNGYPVELCISDMNGVVLANHEEIGWFDEGEHTEDLHDITINELNTILREYNGMLEIDVKETNTTVPVFQDEKVIIRYIN